MKEAKTEYYVQVQRRKTIKYGENQHHQDYITIPAGLSNTLDLQAGQIMRCALNGNGNSLIYTRIAEKPAKEKMTYEKWRDRVEKFTPTEENGKTYEQIRTEGNIPIRTAPALWVKLAETELGLLRKRHPKTHRILWSLNPQTSRPALKDTKLTEIISHFK